MAGEVPRPAAGSGGSVGGLTPVYGRRCGMGPCPPGTEEVASAPASDKLRYCKFVVDGARSNVRASILVRQPGIGSISALSAQ
jgi:hypothetical protein